MTYRRMLDLNGTPSGSVRRGDDGAIIPADPANIDWQAYQAWLTAGNVPAEPEPIRPVLAEKSAAS